MVFVLMPLALVLMLVRQEAVALLFGRGAFGPAAVAEVALLFGVLILVLPLEAMNTMVARYFVARQAIAYALPFQLGGAVMNAGLVYGCVSRWGGVGFSIGTLTFWVLYFVVLAIAMPRLFPEVSLWPALRSLARTAGMGGAAAGLTWGVGHVLRWWTWNPWISATALIGLFGGLYGMVLMLFSPDRDAWQYGVSLWRQFRDRKGGGR
jgi:peptidoglycan biosynthesis protein MviN/MurJ (putative lipid II flippase)